MPCDLYLPIGSYYNTDLLGHANVRQIHQVPDGYRKRNEALVRGSTYLHAFLFSPTFYRSGEWMTVNIAAKMGIPTKFYIIGR